MFEIDPARIELRVFGRLKRSGFEVGFLAIVTNAPEKAQQASQTPKSVMAIRIESEDVQTCAQYKMEFCISVYTKMP